MTEINRKSMLSNQMTAYWSGFLTVQFNVADSPIFFTCSGDMDVIAGFSSHDAENVEEKYFFKISPVIIIIVEEMLSSERSSQSH